MPRGSRIVDEIVKERLAPVLKLIDHVGLGLTTQRTRRQFFAAVKRHAQGLEYKQLTIDERCEREAVKIEAARIHEAAKKAAYQKKLLASKTESE
jgi:hypothetical protein